MSKNLLIVFAKNIKLGKVKTRLAKTIGDNNAFEVYKFLVKKTEETTNLVKNCEVHIYYSDVIIETKWKNHLKFVQQGNDLGERMKDAFEKSFSLGFENVVGVGTDIPDLTPEIISEAFLTLNHSDTVFGPADDGGYYLLGMKKLYREVFDDKEWSTPTLLTKTFSSLDNNSVTYSSLKSLNDIDTIEDLEQSSIQFLLKEMEY